MIGVIIVVNKNFLIFDFGASNGRASIVAFNGSSFRIDVIHRFENIPVSVNGILYWDLLRLYNDLKTGIQIASKKYDGIVSLGIDTWGVDFGFIDKNGKLISNLEHYRDKLRFSTVDDLFKVIDRKKLFEYTGGLILPGISSIFHMLNLKRRNATQFLNADKFLMLPDIFNYFLTGNAFNEYTEATTSIMLNQVSKCWEDKIFDILGISPDIFCKLIQPGEIVGNLEKNVCDELEVEPIQVIVPAAHDTASSVAGFPVIDSKKNILLISMGTWGILIQETNKPLINDTVYKEGFANEGGAEGLNMLLTNIAGLWIIQQCMSKWRKKKGENFDWKDIDVLYPQAKPFSAFIDVDGPVFALASIDMNETVRDYCKLKNQNIPLSIGETARMLYENLVFKIKNKVFSIQNITLKKWTVFILLVAGQEISFSASGLLTLQGFRYFQGQQRQPL